MEEKIRESIEKDNGFIKSNGFKIIELTSTKAVMECELKPSSLNPMGIAHGGLLFGLADTCAGILAFTTGKKCVTSSANMNYLKPAKDKIVAIATILKTGKNIGYYNVEIKNDKDELVAVSTVNMFFTE